MGNPMPDHPDRFLATRMMRGDEAAFTEFFESHFAPLFRFAMTRVGNDAQVAEDDDCGDGGVGGVRRRLADEQQPLPPRRAAAGRPDEDARARHTGVCSNASSAPATISAGA